MYERRKRKVILMEDSKIIDLFFDRSESAVVELSNKYRQLCFRIAMNVLGNTEDAEECVNDTFLAVWNAIPPQNPTILKAFVGRIARNISINKYNRNSAEKRNPDFQACLDELGECIAGGLEPEDEYDASQIAKYIDEYLDTLSKTNRLIFVRRYWYMDSYEYLSCVTGLNTSAVRKRLSRNVNGLKDYLRSKGVIL